MTDREYAIPMIALGKGLLLLAVLTGSVIGGRWVQRKFRSSARSLISNDEHNEINGVSVDALTDDDHLISRAQILYGQYCAKCHGEHGHGDGEGLQPLTVRPRDFRSKQWRFAKNQEAIEQVIRNGIPGTPMPSSKSAMSDDDISQVAKLVLEFGEAESQYLKSDRDNMIALAGFSPVIPDQIPATKLVDETGQSVNLSELVTGPAIIHFWGTACVHCIADLPEMNRRAQRLKESGIKVVSICGDQVDPSEINEFARDYPHLDFYVDPSGLAMNRFSTSLLPTQYLVDESRTIIAVSHDSLTDAMIDNIISELAPPVP